IIGDGNSVGTTPKLELTRYFARRQRRQELDWLSPYTLSIPLVGRTRELQDLQAWLADPRPLLAQVMTGRGGRGKTRLALELCDWASDSGWAAGFVASKEFERFFAHQNLSAWGWDRPTLIVIDYAAQHAQALSGWIEELADRSRPCEQSLRVLL